MTTHFKQHVAEIKSGTSEQRIQTLELYGRAVVNSLLAVQDSAQNQPLTPEQLGRVQTVAAQISESVMIIPESHRG